MFVFLTRWSSERPIAIALAHIVAVEPMNAKDADGAAVVFTVTDRIPVRESFETVKARVQTTHDTITGRDYARQERLAYIAARGR